MSEKFRTVVLYKNYFADFLAGQRQKVKDKIVWTLKLIEELPRVPETYLKSLEETDGLFEIRIKQGSDIFRVFCFFDEGKLIVLMNGFVKKTQKTPKQEIEKALKIKEEYYAEKSSTKTLKQFVDEEYGERGLPKRERFENGYEQFKLGILIQEARLEKGLTQAQLAEKCGANRADISKIENNVNDVRLSTLQKIIEVGLGGHLELSIKL